MRKYNVKPPNAMIRNIRYANHGHSKDSLGLNLRIAIRINCFGLVGVFCVLLGKTFLGLGDETVDISKENPETLIQPIQPTENG